MPLQPSPLGGASAARALAIPVALENLGKNICLVSEVLGALEARLAPVSSVAPVNPTVNRATPAPTPVPVTVHDNIDLHSSVVLDIADRLKTLLGAIEI